MNETNPIFAAFGHSQFSNVPAAGQPLYSAQASSLASLLRFNPLASCTPSRLAAALDSFDAGWLSDGARIFRAIAGRDDTIVSVKPKRELAASEADWQIAIDPDADPTTAKLHAAVLRRFYNGVVATSATDRNQRGGFSALRRSMMEAASYRYAVHHLVWQPKGTFTATIDGIAHTLPAISAMFESVPLEHFENTSGRLRYIPIGTVACDGIAGAELDWERGEWMVTCGDGLMFAAAICYMFKRLSMSDWVEFCQDFAQGKVLGRTSAAEDSPAGKAFAQLVSSFTGGSRSVVFGDDGSVTEPIQTFQNSGTASADVFAKLIERMDRKIAAMYRGADLSTMSAGSGEGSGASLQGGEADILHRADVRMLCESLWSQVDKHVIEWTFGRGVVPAAYVSIPLASDPDLVEMRESAGFLADRGVPISSANLCERLGFSLAGDGEAVLQPQAAALPTPPPDYRPAFNSRPAAERRAATMKAFLKESVADVADGLAEDFAELRIALAPLRDALISGDAVAASEAARVLKDKLPALGKEILRAPSSAQFRLNAVLAPALLDGLISDSVK